MKANIDLLIDKGFILKDKNELSGYKMYYEFSDYELLEFELFETIVNEKSIVNVDKMTIYDPIHNTQHLKIDYTLSFKIEEFNKFYELLTLLGYKI